MKITIYPRNINQGSSQVNPYIQDFIQTLEQNGVTIANSPHKNPLFSLLPSGIDSDAYIFHWLENVPDYKYGLLQTVAAIWLLLKIKRKGKKIIWFLHNKQPHLAKHRWSKNILIKKLLQQADLIVTHATEGIEVVTGKYPKAVAKTLFLHHPTKNKITPTEPLSVETDLLIWGNISRYKGVVDFMRFAKEQPFNLKTRIIGRCASPELWDEIAPLSMPCVAVENRSLSFDELKQAINKSRFVLIPYASESILSSGILMDSLSLGAKVIGPAVGSFQDYAREPLLKVYTFHTFAEIASIVQHRCNEEANVADYQLFLEAHSWREFGKQFVQELQKLTQ